MKLELSQSEVKAVIDYIWQHTRASTKGTGFKVWQKMFKFQNGQAEKEMPSDDQRELFSEYYDRTN